MEHPYINPLLLDTDIGLLRTLLQDARNARDEHLASTQDENKSQDRKDELHILSAPGTTKDQVSGPYDDDSARAILSELKDIPTVFTNWDYKNLPLSNDTLQGIFLNSYISWAQTIVRNPVDVVFLTHILLYLSTSVPSAIYLYYNFNIIHAIFHWLIQLSYCGSFTLMLHNHIHNNGLLSKRYAWFDHFWPYVLEPLMGHTWDSYYYHHVKHHHIENNGPEDLSSTIRYQRDELWHFLLYVGRFIFFIWIELPLYFFRKGKPGNAIRVIVSELVSYLLLYILARKNFYPTLFVFIIPLVQMRIGLMIGNFGQHALVDDVDPKSDFRSSITLIDVAVSTNHLGSFCPFVPLRHE